MHLKNKIEKKHNFPLPVSPKLPKMKQFPEKTIPDVSAMSFKAYTVWTAKNDAIIIVEIRLIFKLYLISDFQWKWNFQKVPTQYKWYCFETLQFEKVI